LVKSVDITLAVTVGCHRSTVSRELARMPEGAYDPRLAQRDAERAARRPKARKLDANPPLRAYVSVNIVFTNFVKILSPYPTTLFHQTRQRTFTTSG